jgi:hypothetical protein
MRLARISIALSFLLLGCLRQTAAQQQEALSLTGKLTRVMAIGGESTGWAIQFDSATTIDNKPLHSIEVDGPTTKFQTLENKQVKVKGKLTHKHGVEIGERPVLIVSSIKEIKPKTN